MKINKNTPLLNIITFLKGTDTANHLTLEDLWWIDVYIYRKESDLYYEGVDSLKLGAIKRFETYFTSKEEAEKAYNENK